MKYDYKITLNDAYIIDCTSEMEGVVQEGGFVVIGSSSDKYIITLPSNFENITSISLEKFKNE